MVIINKIYTRTGDDGTTGLVGGKREAKNSPRVSACGDVDELNAFAGQARTLCEELARQPYPQDVTGKLALIQNELFDLGAYLATLSEQAAPESAAALPGMTSRLETWIDELTEGMCELRSFVLPGGTQLNGVLHQCRTICRRAERSVITLSHANEVNPHAVHYLNRLSDLFFAMARFESHRSGIPERLWQPGADSGAMPKHQTPSEKSRIKDK